MLRHIIHSQHLIISFFLFLPLLTQAQLPLLEKAESFYQAGNSDSALAIINRVTESGTAAGNDSLQADFFNLAGNIYEDMGNFHIANENYYNAMKLFFALGNKKGLAHAVNNVANMYYRKGMYDQALKYQSFALKLRTGLKDTTGIASSYNNIGNIFFSWKQYEKALAFYNKAIKLKSESGDTLELINIRLNIGSAWLGLNNYELARFHYTEALRLADVGNNYVLKADGLINMGYNEFLNGATENSLHLYNEALKISEKYGLDFEKMLALKNKGELFIYSGKYGEAERFLDSSEALCHILGIRESQMEILRLRTDLLIKQEKHKEAWDVYDEYRKMNDDLFSETKQQQLYDFQALQEFEARQKEMKIKDLQIKLKNNQLDSLRLILLISVISLFLVAVTIVLLMKARFRKKEMAAVKRQHAARQKALSAQMNPHFISNSLSSIQNYFLNNDLAAASDYLNRFGKLIRKVLDLSMKELIPLEEELELIRLYVQLEELRLGKPVHLRMIFSDDFPTDSAGIPPLLLQPVIENAIWHGISEHEKDGEISISCEWKDEFFYCMIRDNGNGLTEINRNVNPRKEKSYGLSLTRERLSLMSPGIPQDELCVITELKDASQKVSGVEVKMKIKHKYV
jgi:tetratricopeptide (TPR) repeat protein